MLSSTSYVNQTTKDSMDNQIRRETIEFLKKNIPLEKGDVLDIGCSNGFFLSGLDNGCRNLFGIDCGVNSENIENRNITIFNMPIESFHISRKFDLITLLNTLEHISNPHLVIKKIYSILEDEGYFLIDIPNSLTPTIKISEFFSFEHVSNFTLATLKFLLLSEGFEIVADEIKKSSIRVICRKKIRISKDKINFENLSLNAKNLKNVLISYNLRKNKFVLNIIQIINDIDLKKYSGKMGVFGAGWHTLQLYDLVDFNNHVKYYFDSDKRKQGTFFLDRLVLSPNDIPKANVELVIISSGNYQREMYNSIKLYEELGVKIIKLYPDDE
jgi:2-polyprenyl-3-methyl-5-hydroxy-6-metoxy-1,4-benzoquinol methylase